MKYAECPVKNLNKLIKKYYIILLIYLLFCTLFFCLPVITGCIRSFLPVPVLTGCIRYFRENHPVQFHKRPGLISDLCYHRGRGWIP